MSIHASRAVFSSRVLFPDPMHQGVSDTREFCERLDRSLEQIMFSKWELLPEKKGHPSKKLEHFKKDLYPIRGDSIILSKLSMSCESGLLNAHEEYRKIISGGGSSYSYTPPCSTGGFLSINGVLYPMYAYRVTLECASFYKTSIAKNSTEPFLLRSDNMFQIFIEENKIQNLIKTLIEEHAIQAILLLTIGKNVWRFHFPKCFPGSLLAAEIIRRKSMSPNGEMMLDINLISPNSDPNLSEFYVFRYGD